MYPIFLLVFGVSAAEALRGGEGGQGGGGEGGGYWSLQLSPNSVSTLPFRGRHISVWEHATDKGRYYSMPIVDLMPETARTYYNLLIKTYVMKFDILMWTEDTRIAVFNHLKAEGWTGQGGEDLTMNDVELLPMEKVRLTWRGTDPLEQSGFRLQDKWTSNTNLPSVLSFHFTCNEKSVCDDLARAMQNRPEIFDGFEVEYIINGQRSARRQVRITGDNIMNGNLYTNLLNMPSTSTIRYLNSEDVKTVAYESTMNVVASVVSDSDYVDTGDDISISNLIERELTRNQVSSAGFRPHMWESVFWNPSFARPDRLTKTLNEMLSKDAVDNSSLILSEQSDSQSISSSDDNEKGLLGLVKSHTAEDGSSSNQKKVNKENLLKTLSEKYQNVEWSGEVFQVKPVKLYRLNLSSFKSRNNIAVANLQVRRFETVHSIKVVSGENNYDVVLQNATVWSEIQGLQDDLLNLASGITEVASQTITKEEASAHVGALKSWAAQKLSGVANALAELRERHEEELEELSTQILEVKETSATARTTESIPLSPCPSGWVQKSTGCYHVSPSGMTWTQAQQYCTAKGGYLVEVDTPEEHAQWNDFLDNSNDHWIGLTDVAQEGTFVWQHSLKEPTYTAWYGSEPNNSGDGEDCAHMVKDTEGEMKFLWNDKPCTALSLALCERSPDLTSPSSQKLEVTERLSERIVETASEMDELAAWLNAFRDSHRSVKEAVNKLLEESPCPSGWDQKSTGCYHVSATAMNWFAAQQYCIDRGGHLVEVDSAEEQAQWNSFLDNKNDYWLGLTDLAQEGTFVWQTSLEEPRYTSWCAGEPNNNRGIEDCAHTVRHTEGGVKFLWNDKPCNRTDGLALCERSSGLKKVDLGCESDWTRMGDSCYHVSEENMTWFRANEYCDRLGGGLIEIETAEEQDRLRGLLDTSDGSWYWTGLSDLASEGTFVWSRSGREPSYAPWHRGEVEGKPNNFNGTEHCAILWKSSWLDVECYESWHSWDEGPNRALCEMSALA